MDEGPAQGVWGFIKSFLKKRGQIEDENELAEEIHELIDEGQAKGLITDEESHMVFQVLDLKEKVARSIMIPRTAVRSAPTTATLGQLISLITRWGHTRIPIYQKTMDDIVGILHAKDLLRLWGRDPDSPLPQEIFRQPYFVSGNKPLGELLREFRTKRVHLAVVTDEYGGTDGIVTLEDIIEEIVGEIRDEHDSEESYLTVREDGSLVVDARLEIEKLEPYVGKVFPRADYESVGGLLIHLTGRIPAKGETVEFEDLEFKVQEGEPRKIGIVVVQRKAPEKSEAEKSPPEPPSLP